MSDLIVARYQESVEWIAEVPEGFRVHLYNKGLPVTSHNILGRLTSLTNLENGGRESESYLRHLVSGQTAPSGYAVFTQGDPFEHSPDFIKLISNVDAWRPVQPLSWCWKQSEAVPPQSVNQLYADRSASSTRVRPETYSLISWNPLSFFDREAYQIATYYRKVHNLAVGSHLAAHFLELCGFASLASIAAEYQVGYFSYGAIFGVSAERLTLLPEHVITQMLEVARTNVIHGYMFERMWLHIFGEPFYTPFQVCG